jgi:hypothetical protein
MEGIYVRLRASIEAEVQVRGRRLPINNVDVGETRLALSLVELRDTEGPENDLVEADAFTVVARTYIKVINDRASPVPFLSRHGRRLPDSVADGKLRRLGQCSGMTPEPGPCLGARVASALASGGRRDGAVEAVRRVSVGRPGVSFCCLRVR